MTDAITIRLGSAGRHLMSGETVIATVAPPAWELLDGRRGTVRDGVAIPDADLRIDDEWSAGGAGAALLRRITVDRGSVDIRFDDRIALAPGPLRFLVPGLFYSASQWEAPGDYLRADDRLAYPIVAAFDGRRVMWWARSTTGTRDGAAQRAPGAARFVRDTDLGAMGFATAGDLLSAWPVAERDRSAALDSRGTPLTTFRRLSAGDTVELRYEFGVAAADTYSEAVAVIVRRMLQLGDTSPSDLPVAMHEAIDLRLDSAAKTYRETTSGFAAFALNFDPERGYDAQAKAFGASFSDHEMGGSRAIVEYGFTGRQLDIARQLAQRDPGVWGERAARVLDGFVQRMADPSGWVATLYDLDADRPVFAVGDQRGTVMHYLGSSSIAGTYTRMMTEAGADLLAAASDFRGRGHNVDGWIAGARGLADFLLGVQNEDGSWFRAYAPDGTAITGGDWFGDPAGSARTATSAVVPFLLAVASEFEDEIYLDAAIRAGAWVLDNHVVPADYRGGTLDNPALVDKEAAFLAMRALLALHRMHDSAGWRDGAVAAAWIAVSWHSLWNVPHRPGTPLAEAGVRSVGWGGINSVWGVGVTDIYSLFFAGDLAELGAVAGIPEFGTVAALIAHSSLQLLAVPGDLHGFADTGMQPEGIAFSDQGVDDGLISKGDTWGGLAWPYTAGTLGLRDFLARTTLASDTTK